MNPETKFKKGKLRDSKIVELELLQIAQEKKSQDYENSVRPNYFSHSIARVTSETSLIICTSGRNESLVVLYTGELKGMSSSTMTASFSPGRRLETESTLGMVGEEEGAILLLLFKVVLAFRKALSGSEPVL